LNAYRSFGFGADTHHVPAVAINMFFSKFEVPKEAEGFQSVHLIPFVPHKFDSQEEEKYFYSITY
jgi:hypothetical protein